MEKQIRVIVVDDHVVFREGLKSVLAAFGGIEVVGEASSATEAIILAEAARPDLMIVDLALPGLDGCETARRLRDRRPEVRLFALTGCEAVQDLLDALEAGFEGYALKSDPPEEVVGAIRRVAAGQRHVTPALAQISERVRRAGLPRNVLALLSAREREVFLLTTSGRPAAEIAGTLAISRKTVETHRYRIQKKLGLRSASDLVRFAALHDLIPPAPADEGAGRPAPSLALGLRP
jgi:two-component system, NarL family, invasion response regulator UvrY